MPEPWKTYNAFELKRSIDEGDPYELLKKAYGWDNFGGDEGAEGAERCFGWAHDLATIRNLPDTKIRGGRSGRGA